MQSLLQFRHSRQYVQHRLDGNGSPWTIENAKVSNEQSINWTKTQDNNEGAVIVVEFEENDGHNPRCWSFWRRVFTTVIVLSTGVVGGWASSNDSTIVPQAMETFGVGEIAESLATGLYLVAFGVGSLVCGPFSETVGRDPVYIVTLVLFILFLVASALAPNLGAQLVFRYCAGLLGCTAVTTFAGTVADLWAPQERSLVFTLASVVNFCGIFLSPCVGSFIGQSTNISWRWTEWIAVLMGSFSLVAIVLLARETYAPVILSWRAKHLRDLTGNTHFRSKHEMTLEPLSRRLLRSLYRPFDMFRREITVVLFTLYLTVLYVVSFSFLTAYPIIYGDIYGFSQGSVGLCFLSLDVGILIAGAIGVPLHRKYTWDLAKAKEAGQESLPPESRLWFVMICAPPLPIGIFIMAWTSYAHIPFWASLAGSVCVGISFLGIFVGVYLYLIDTFESLSASALAISTFGRYLAAGAMIPVSIPMYDNLGVHWALTLLGCLSVPLTVVPFVYYKYGQRIRESSQTAKK